MAFGLRSKSNFPEKVMAGEREKQTEDKMEMAAVDRRENIKTRQQVRG